MLIIKSEMFYYTINMNNITLNLSGVVEKDGKKIAHVRFNRGKDFAEGYIPDCVFTVSLLRLKALLTMKCYN